MRTFFCLMVWCVSPLAYSQLTITRDDFWSIGDQYELLGVVPDTLMEGNPGQGQNWVFNNLVRDSQFDRTVEMVDPLFTTLGSSYPRATHAEFEDVNGSPNYVFYEVTQNEVTLLGVFGQGVSAIYADGATFFPFPMSYGVESDDVFSASFNTGGGQIERTGTIETECDASGSLTINGETFQNAIRVRTEQKIEDMTAGFLIKTDTVSYAYFVSEDKRWPVFVISYVETDVGGFSTSAKNAFYRDLTPDEPPPTDSFTRMLPHMTSPTGGFEAELIFWNSAPAQSILRVRAMNGQGDNLAEVDITMNGREIRRVQVQTLFPGQNPTHFGLTGADDVKSVIAYRAANGQAATAHLAEDASHSREYWAYPGEWDLIFDGMALVNTGSAEALVTAELVGGNAANATLSNALAINGKYISTFDSVFADASDRVLHITSSQNLAATFLKGTYLGNEPSFLYANNPHPETDIFIVERWIPHITRVGGGFETDVLLLNTGNSTELATITGYQNNGSIVFAQNVPLMAGELRRVPAADFFMGQDVSHIASLASGKVLVSAAYKSATGQAASAFVHQNGDGVSEVLVFLGEQDLVFDGMALVNIGTSATDIRGELLNEQGNILESKTLATSLGVRSKTLAVFGDTFTQANGFAVRLTADEAFSAIFLRGTYPGANPAFLFANPSLVK